MLSPAEIRPRAEILGFGAVYNAAVWNKHRAFLSAAKIPTGAAMRALDALSAVHKARATRKHVFDIADSDPAAGAAAAIIWGFPKGGLRGRWQPFAEAFRQADRYGEAIAGMRSASMMVTASEALARLNSVQPGVGFATTSKIAYFARLPLLEGRALIYDSNVILSIKASQDDAFALTRAALGPGKAFHHRGTSSYGAFIAEAEALGRELQVSSDQIEVALFLRQANPRSGWH